MITKKQNYRVQFADPTPEQVELVRKMGSKSRSESLAATEVMAAIMAKPILQVIEQAPVVSNLFTTETYSAGSPSNILLDDYFDIRNRNFLNVWSQSQPGGTATNFVEGATELFVQTYPIFSSITLNKNYLRAGQVNHLANNLTRLVQEVLLVQETNSANILFPSLAGARIDGVASNVATNNLTLARSNTADVFQMDDFNTLIEMYDNVVASWVGGTPVNELREITDLLGSVRWMSQIRSMAYQPQNTRQGSVATQGASSIAATDDVRQSVWKSAGIATLFDKNLHKVYEMGVGKSFNSIFGVAIGSTALPGYGTGFGGGTTSVFNSATEELVLGLNTAMFDLVRLRMSDAGSQFTLVADDSLSMRSGKTSLYGELTEGYISVEGRSKAGLVF